MANYLNGTNKSDDIRGTTSNDIINGRAGDDTLNGIEGNDIINGDDGFDQIFGENGDDSLNGGKGNDSLSGSNGSDVYRPGLGNDTMDEYNPIYGVSGDGVKDTFIFEVPEKPKSDGNFGVDYINFFEPGVDKIIFSGYTPSSVVVGKGFVDYYTEFKFSDGSYLQVLTADYDTVSLTQGVDYDFV
jgi:Ca2+-binding RTX toxin-like protein